MSVVTLIHSLVLTFRRLLLLLWLYGEVALLPTFTGLGLLTEGLPPKVLFPPAEVKPVEVKPVEVKPLGEVKPLVEVKPPPVRLTAA